MQEKRKSTPEWRQCEQSHVKWPQRIFNISFHWKRRAQGRGITGAEARKGGSVESILPPLYSHSVSPQGRWRALSSLYTTVLLKLPCYLFFAPGLSVCFRSFPFVYLLFSPRSHTYDQWMKSTGGKILFYVRHSFSIIKAVLNEKALLCEVLSVIIL